MSRIKSILIDLKLKIKHNKWPFIICIIFWIIGFAYYIAFETDQNIWHLIAITFGIRSPNFVSDFSGFYQLMWPILIEVIVIGFIFGALIEKFNPVLTSKLVAENQRNHSVIIGYHHFGRRIVDYLQKHNKPYTVIEENEENVDFLISEGEPVIVGDPTDITNLEFAGVQHAKEIFLVVNDVREIIVVCEKVRELNNKCTIYTRILGESYSDYLAREPFNALSFSTSTWALESVREWTRGERGKVVVLGRDSLAQRITEYLGREQHRETFLIDPDIDESFYDDDPTITLISDKATILNALEEHVDLNTVSQIFICWKEEDEFSDTIKLTSHFHQKYPSIKVYTRIFDEELGPIMKKFGATVFSTSQYAFKKLQEHVYQDSAIKEI
ncbi:NAD-binding protein [Promethearchaeum syntrophicum]|uniref:NAD-binding protein n=1 Tax=Promethearchaeum syntrophicum TaxID=2594042 RepID=A0A5B9DD41_9ARCH|nr:NAD(P)-binding protein [Candidatus Prometheoarchaeum syntrophicum]QEE16915.1 voltage-gated potassium channel [Candidatus Prometheoarchaeum syntrophicum]